MKKPNFFIIGAPRCGTTSLVSWLRGHPNIFIPPKEIHFWSTDLNYPRPQSIKEYEGLFSKASEGKIAIGEKSPSYFFSEVAVRNIENEYPGSRYIVMLRNPVEMAYSLWKQRLFIGVENIRNFLDAWKLSPERRAGRNVPITCSEPKMLDYQNICLLGNHLERLFRIVSPAQVLVLLLDDLKRDPRAAYLRILEFLGVPDDGRTEFTPKNVGAKYYLSIPTMLRRFMYKSVRALKIGNNPLAKAVSRILISRSTESLDPYARRLLLEFYKDDILKLGDLINRDLRHWIE